MDHNSQCFRSWGSKILPCCGSSMRIKLSSFALSMRQVGKVLRGKLETFFQRTFCVLLGCSWIFQFYVYEFVWLPFYMFCWNFCYDCTHCCVTYNCCCGDFSATSSSFLSAITLTSFVYLSSLGMCRKCLHCSKTVYHIALNLTVLRMQGYPWATWSNATIN